MAQLQLPIFQPGTTLINASVGYERRDGYIVYSHGLFPLFIHKENDIASFNFITSQMVLSGHVKQIEIANAFGVPYISVKRHVKLLRTEGTEGFFKSRTPRSAHVLKPKVLQQAQRLLDKGYNCTEIGQKLQVKPNTLRKAIQQGKLHKREDTATKGGKTSEKRRTKSERAVEDSAAKLGIGCTREQERVEASLGELNGVSPQFSQEESVGCAGVLFALPSLLLNGLLKHTKQFSLPKGYYGLQSLMLIVAFCVLLRIKSIEKIQYKAVGELGKVVGLDRIPEVRTLRQKIKYLSEQGDPGKWSRELAQDWLQNDPSLAGTLYIDGHVRPYHGKQTKLPRHFTSREKLCLRGVVDYWVNDALGKPFFVISQTVNPGMIQVLTEQIVPRLLEDITGQPSEEELESRPYLYRFGMIFDREGYSPKFFKEMWKKRITCTSYRKFAKEEWAEEEFSEREIQFPNGEVNTMRLAERGTYYEREKLWVREIRKLTETGHQTALITTNYQDNAEQIAGSMFSRWSQENFFKYMMEHYGIDRLIDYEVEKMDETIKVVNPRHRMLEAQVRKKCAQLSRRKAEYGALELTQPVEETKLKDFMQKKAELRETIESLEQEISELKEAKKKEKKHITIGELPESDKFQDLKKSGKQFIDTIKMIAYRAETAMANYLRQYISKRDEARALVRQILSTDADICPDEEKGILHVKIHNMSNPRNNTYIEKLCEILNETATVFPGTNMVLFYELVSNQNPRDQEF